jgi:cobalamin synthase
VDGVKTVHVAGAAVLFAVGAALSFIVFEWTLPALIFLSFLAAAIATALVVRRMTRKLGGVTGDVIGFSIEFSQLVFLLFSAIAVIIL